MRPVDAGAGPRAGRGRVPRRPRERGRPSAAPARFARLRLELFLPRNPLRQERRGASHLVEEPAPTWSERLYRLPHPEPDGFPWDTAAPGRRPWPSFRTPSMSAG
ncbi:hypothetical protein FRACA_810025 [Frankia canadensis]|uniref:Uncharacterized protein n=1 Tax=Frankia canadensis TaxID=1836972 RepID=A0A2I2L1P0_9ACTN|nr:hypothetical protein FRACA_810025 [Frankia canadensis]SOU59124.1 hypothetical protein FRACA_810025 [Frankia canadensis]